MSSFASAFRRAGLLSVTVYVLAILFAAAQLLPRNPIDAQHTLRDALHLESLTTLAVSTALLAGYFLKGRGDPFEPSGDWVSRMAKVFMGAIALTACVLVIFVLVGAIFRGLTAITAHAMYPRTLVRLGFSLMMATAIVRMTLPLLSRSDRISPHNE